MKAMNRTIKDYQKEVFEQKISEVNKKLRKIHCSEISIVSKEYHRVELMDRDGRMYPGTVIDYVLSIPEITRLDNVEYIGTISYKTGIKTVYTKQDEIILSNIDEKKLVCDHCRVNRYRNIYHIFKKDGKLLSIGSSCSKYFLDMTLKEF